MNAEKRRQILAGLAEAGRILPAAVEGLRTPFFYRSEDEALMRAVLAGQVDLRPRMSFIAPLDPLLWDKALILALWDFRYSWEIYTPAAKRRYGYYTLPILFGDAFVGRVEAAADRREGLLRVRGLWLEAGVRRTKKLSSALDRALRGFARFNDCREAVMGPDAFHLPDGE